MFCTMELILGLKPMSQFDAAATPMFNSFHATPDLRPCLWTCRTLAHRPSAMRLTLWPA
jgi:hypothetical protein